ncbi:SDR family oxidoreductase [Chitinophaga nivalis]|uniref:SDR family oxidoreductase n=1 Tax=Chitinophaga nivalis TaxID=2991709 RepID=A0ABT3IIW4_9BACT|nr:SDR family oxidoreductase [Chitinophaga nivalis]MCW3466401.1 SDR family oxidoreductase [Chitinophaga nivalis]MCW3483908.1 SDR family oxidoreductase [Chitinophaga nivalis]
MKKTIFITGASSGFGKATVQLFHQKGWNVIATMRSPEKEPELAALPGVLVTKLDVTDNDSITQAVQTGIQTFGRIDVLVNNAGFGTLGALEAAPEPVIRQQFDVNFFGLIEVTRAVLPGMRAQQAGTIINVSSVGGRVTFPFSTLYHATKFAVEGLTESLQYELNPLGIRLKLVEPGGYKTDFAGRSMSYYGVGSLTDYQPPFDQFLGKLEQWPMSENLGEVAEAIYAAATDNSDKLRYPVGQDAVALLEARQQTDDITFKKMLISQTGI